MLKAIKQINFAGNMDWAGKATIFFIVEEIILDFSEGTGRVL